MIIKRRPCIPLTIICPVYNNHKFTRHIFSQLEELDTDAKGYEVIIYDDGSTDGTQDLIPNFRHIKINAEKNGGVTEAWNNSINRATGKFILVINNDIVINNEVVDEMMNLLRQDDNCFVANGKQLMTGGKIVNGPETDTDNISGPCWMIRKKDWAKIGPIPSKLKMFGNDDYIYLKVTQGLKKKSLWTEYPIYHFTSQTVKDYPTLSEVTINDINTLVEIVKRNKWSHPKLFEMKEAMKI